jgi:hypothetical protein
MLLNAQVCSDENLGTFELYSFLAM